MTCRRSWWGWRSPVTASRVWSWPGNTADSALIRQVRDDIREWTLSRVIWVADRGFASAQNRRALMRGGGGYIIGEKLRSGSAEARAALSRQGRYATVTGNMQVKEVSIGADDRFIICRNPAQAERDAAIRAKMTAQLEEAIKDTDQLDAAERAKIEGALSGKQGLKRFLRVTSGGLLRVDKAKVKAEENLDGKYLLRCSDPDLSAEDIAVGYKQLLEVERGWRDMKQVLDLRPVYHRREDRIRAHVVLCWLALLLIRVTETSTGQTWGEGPRRAAAHARRHLVRPGRHVPAGHRPDQAAAGHIHGPGPGPAQEDHRHRARAGTADVLTCTFTSA